MMQHIDAIAASVGTQRFAFTLQKEFEQIAGKSIDYAVMERYDDVSGNRSPVYLGRCEAVGKPSGG